jgi:hypothetical protein
VVKFEAGIRNVSSKNIPIGFGIHPAFYSVRTGGCFSEIKKWHPGVRGPLMVAQWLRYCAANWQVAGSIPDGVIGIFH